MTGGDGNDRIWAGTGTDSLSGGAGNDFLYAAANDGLVDTVDCGDGNDRAVVREGDTTTGCETVVTIKADGTHEVTRPTS